MVLDIGDFVEKAAARLRWKFNLAPCHRAVRLAEKLTYSAEYSDEDEAYLACCLELGVTTHGDTPEQAIEEAKEATSLYLDLMIAVGQRWPVRGVAAQHDG